MNNENQPKNIRRLLPLLLILVAVVILAVIAAGMPPEAENGGEVKQTGPAISATSPTDNAGEKTGPTQEQFPTETETPPWESLPEETTDPTDEGPDFEDLPSVEIQQQKDAEYERWLAAAMVVCVSIEYPDFEFEAVYAASATKLEDKFSSDGAYIVFTSGGKRYAIHSEALEHERTESGTTDISTEVIGFASFDQVSPDKVDFETMEPIRGEELNDLISQSLLISVYNH